MKLQPLNTLDFAAVADIRRACGSQFIETLDNVATGRSVAYRLSGAGILGTVVLQKRSDLLLIEAVAGRDDAAQFIAKVKAMAKLMARALHCKGFYAFGKTKAHERFYSRICDRKFILSGKTVFYGVA